MRQLLKQLFSGHRSPSRRRRSNGRTGQGWTSAEHLEARTLLTSEFALVSDIDTTEVSSLPYPSAQSFAQVGDQTFFVGETETTGIELWVTDGTPNGTRLVRDISTRDSQPQDLTAFNDRLYFTADDGIHGRELWVSDGTEAGTQMLVDLYEGNRRSSSPGAISVVNDALYFRASTPTQSGLWKTDGTAGGTTFVVDVRPNTAPVAMGDMLYFQASHGGSGYELWKSDGTAAGTSLVKDVNPGSGTGVTSAPVVANDRIYFVGNHPDSGRELWVSDGTEAGTQILVDMVPGTGTAYPNGNVVAVGGKVYFTTFQHNVPDTGNELWVTDGTPAGTQVVKDINPGTGSGNPRYLQAYREHLYFVAQDASGTASWWKTDGTETGTVTTTFADIDPLTVRGTTVFNDRIYLRTVKDSRSTLWKTDGTSDGTIGLGEIGHGTLNVAASSDAFYFTAKVGDATEVWRTDGSVSGTSLLVDFTPGTASSAPRGLTTIGDALIFSAEQRFQFGRELWITGGDADSTELLHEFNTRRNGHGDPGAFLTVNGRTIFAADPGTGTRTFAIEHTNRTITEIAPYKVQPVPGSPADSAILGSRVIFPIYDGRSPAYGTEPGVSDGTAAGTFMLKDVYGGFRSSKPRHFTRVGDEVFFTAEEGGAGRELWKTDGTAAGTVRVRDVRFGSSSGLDDTNLASVNGRLVFAAVSDSSTGVELWVSDGTESGTVLLKDLWSESHLSSRPRSFVSDESSAWFFANNENGLGLYQTDATETGTVLIRQFDSEAVAPALDDGQTLLVNGRLYFVMSNASNGAELWASDGSGAGTQMIRDIRLGAESANITNLTEVDGTVFFVADDGIRGTEVWKTDGTEAGTVLAADIESGPQSSLPAELINHGGVLYFTAYNSTYGRELFKLNAVPTAADGIYATQAGEPVGVTLSGNDADGTPVDYQITVAPSHGTLTGSAPNLVYTPATGFSGADEFYFTTSDGVASSLPAKVTVTVRGSNPIVSFDQHAATTAENGGRVEIPYSLDRPAPFDFDVVLAISGDAVTDSDFITKPTLTVPAGTTSGIVVFEVVNDTTYEPGAAETAIITMQPGPSYDLGARTATSIEIVDDDTEPTVSFERGFYIVDEASQTHTVRIVSSAASTQPIDIPFTVSGTATAGSDYTPPADLVARIEPGGRFADIHFDILNDSEIESLERVVFEMGVPVNAQRGTGSGQRRRTTVSIRPNDTPLVRFSTPSMELVENSGSSEVTLELSEPAPYSFSVPFTLDGTATPSTDFSLSAQEFQFAAGDTEASITVALTNDTEVEGSEFLVLTLSPSSSSAYATTPQDDGFIFVVDDDAGLSIEAAETLVWEDHGAAIDVTVTLGTPLQVDTEILVSMYSSNYSDDRFSLDGSAARFRTITIPKFETTATMKLKISDNGTADPDAAVFISARKSDASYSSRKTAQIRVRDNDPTLSLRTYVPPKSNDSERPAFAVGRFTSRQTGQPRHSRSTRTSPPPRNTPSVSVSENAGTIRLDFRLSKETNRAVSFDLSAYGTATVATGGATWPDIEDPYGQLNSRITIPAGQGYKSPYSITLGIVDDTDFEGDETLDLKVSNIGNANVPRRNPVTGRRMSERGGAIETKVKLIDDDTLPTVSIEADRTQLFEQADHRSIKVVDGQPLPRGEFFMLDVNLSRRLSRDVEVQLSDLDSAAKEGTDFRIIGLNKNGKVVIPAGHLSARLRVEVIDDEIYEGDERLELSLTNVDGDVAELDHNNRKVTITVLDNESPPAPPKPEPPATLESNSDVLDGVIAGQLQISNAQGAFGEVSEEEVDRLNAMFEANGEGLSPFPGPFQLGNASLGFLDGATVFLDSNFNGVPDFIDLNNNGVQDPGELSELSTTTELDGAFALKFAPAYDRDGDQLFGTADGRFVLTGGDDITIGSSRPVQLTAPVGTFSITPLTTVVESLVRRHIPSVDDALARVAQALGIDGYDIRFGNALYEILQGDALAAEAYKQSVLLHNSALQIAAAYAGVSPNIDHAIAVSVTYDTMADLVHNENSVLDPARPEHLNVLIDAVGFELGTELEGSLRSGLLDVMIASASRITELHPVDFDDAHDFADRLLQIKTVVRKDAVDRLQDAASGQEPMSAVVDDFTGSNLDHRIAEATTQVVVPSTILVRSAEVLEGNAGDSHLVFEVHLLGSHDRTISVDYTTADDTAHVSNGDYSAVSGTLTWPAGDNSVKTVSVPVHGDKDTEGDERFSLLLSNAVNGVVRVGQGYGFIVNDDDYVADFAPLADGDARRIRVSTGHLSGSARVDGEVLYDGVFSEPLMAAFNGQDAVEDHFQMEFQGSQLRPDGYSFVGGDPGRDTLEWLAESVTSMTISLSSDGTGFASLTTDAEVPPATMNWGQMEALSSSSTINEHLEIQLDSSLAARLILEDADPSEFGRMRLRDLNETIPPIEFSNPLSSLKIVAANPDTTLTTASKDERFQSTIEFSNATQNESPTSLNLSSASVTENTASGSIIGQLTSTDPDDGDSFVYSLAPGDGDTDNNRFTITGDQLRIEESPNFETKDSYSLRIRTTDSGGLFFEKSFSIAVIDVDEAAPSAVVSALPLTWGSNTISVGVELDDSSGPAAEPKSGVASYDLYVAADSGDWTLFAEDVPAAQTQVTFHAASDTRYWFRAVATDAAGNTEQDDGLPEANTHTLDVDSPVTEVSSASADTASGVITLQLQGTDSGGSGLKAFEVYVSIDDQPAKPVVGSPVAAGSETNGVYSGTLNYQGLLDGVPHTYRFFTRGIDHRGNTEDAPAAPADQIVTHTFTHQTGFEARGIDVQLGQQQRSYVRYVDVLFAGSDNLMDLFNEGRISVERFSPNATSAAVGTGQSITGFGATSRGNSLQLDFGANGIGGRRQAGDGLYRISLDLDGDGDTDDAHFEFFRLWGDANGDGRVTRNDSRRIFEDLNGDGRVDSRDRRDARRRVGHLIDDELLKLIDD